MHNFDPYIIVDIETAGPYPCDYAMLSLGACTLSDPQKTFYCELKPDRDTYQEEAMGIHGLDIRQLELHGMEATKAMLLFSNWVNSVSKQTPIFTAFNAPFDWMFVNDYFLRYNLDNPFGHAALDIKALYMGHKGVPWDATSHRFIAPQYGMEANLPHHALKDALLEAKLFKRIMEEIDEQ